MTVTATPDPAAAAPLGAPEIAETRAGRLGTSARNPSAANIAANNYALALRYIAGCPNAHDPALFPQDVRLCIPSFTVNGFVKTDEWGRVRITERGLKAARHAHAE